MLKTNMMTEKEKMLAGKLYNAGDPELSHARRACREKCRELNQALSGEGARRRQVLADLFAAETDVEIESPFHCDYGWNIRLGKGVFFNFDCVVLDVMPVDIGDHVLIGPAVQIYTAMHPISATERRAGLEFGQAVKIGDDVWIGGGAVICPGVTIGERTVVGAGSVVTRDLPPDVVAAGNPARILRKIDN